MPAPTRGIRVGSAYIEIHPKMSDEELLRALARIDEQVKKSYKRRSDMTRAYNRAAAALEETLTAKYGREIEGRTRYHADAIEARKKLSRSEFEFLARGMERATAEARQAEKEKTAAAEREARLRERIAHQEQILTTRYGRETAQAYLRRLAEMRAAGTRLHTTRVNEAAQLAAAENAAARQAQAAQVRAAQGALAANRLAARSARDAWREARTSATDSIRQVLTAQQQQRRQELAGQRTVTQAHAAELRRQVAANDSALARIEARQRTSVAAVTRRWSKAADGLSKYSTALTELGQAVVTGVVAPIGAAGAAVTALGVASADAMISAQTALRGMGLDLKDTNKLISSMTEYGLETPYSVEDMQMYGTRFVRGNLAHDPNSNSSDPAKRAAAQQHSTKRAVDMVKMIGDMAAYGGITDPEMVSRGMYALSVMQDMNRAGLRSVKQLEAATGVPANELAQMLGFKTRPFTAKEVAAKKKTIKEGGQNLKVPKTYEASAQMMDFMANAKETGGVAGEDVISGLLGRWGDSENGIKGSAERMAAATISGRISNMAEQAKFRLGRMFAKPGKDGSIQYTDFGQAIMGQRVPIYGEDRRGNQTIEGYRYEGGLLQSASDIGSALMGEDGKGVVPKGMAAFFDTINSFVGWGRDTVAFLNEHEGIRDAALEMGKLAAKTAPLILAVGLLSKILTRVGKLLAPVAGLISGAYKGAKGALKIGSQVTGIGSSRVRAAGADAGPDSSFMDRYRARRTALNNGDERGLGRRALDRRSGNNSGTARLSADNSELRRAISQAESDVQRFGREINQLASQRLDRLAAEFAGGHDSVRAAAEQARQAEADVRSAAERLNAVRLGQVRGQVQQLNSNTHTLTTTTRGATSETHTLGRQSLSHVTGDVRELGKSASASRTAIGQLNKNAANLSQRTFSKPIGQMDKLHTSASHVATKIREINGLNLNAVTKEVNELKNALDAAKREASSLATHIHDVEKKTGRTSGSSGGGSKKSSTRKAQGGVLPGYAPGVDSIPVLASPGEAILRPEVAAALGPEVIDSWNSAAVRGRISRFASGGIVNRFGLSEVRDLFRNLNPAPLTRAALQDLAFDATSDRVGGSARDGMLDTGDGAARWVGSGIANQYDGLYDFVTHGSWRFLKRVPTLIGQAVGIAGGTFAPILSEYFHDDVWKGSGNIVERGKTFLDDTFSLKTLKSAGRNLVGGLFDSVKSLVGGAKDLITDPIGTVKDSFGFLWDMGRDEVNYLVDMVKATRDAIQSPYKYGSRVARELLSSAKEALPNTEGLFDFSDHNRVDSEKPDVMEVFNNPTPTGNKVTRWRSLVQMVLGQLGLSQRYTDTVLHRIQVESGGNPNAINLWDSNAKMGTPSQGLMQTIPATFNRYAGPYRSLGITNPTASLYAGLNYATHRYGSRWPEVLSGIKGYWQGTASASPGLALVGERGPELVDFRGGERVRNASETSELLGPRYEIHVHEAKGEPTSGAVLRALRYAEVMHGMN